MNIPRHRALALLTKCTGDEIWSPTHCREVGVPEAWIEKLSDTFESGFQSNTQTIYVEEGLTNQYHGVRDVDLAMELARSLGIDLDRAIATASSRQAVVAAIKQAMMDGE
ncbi:MAG: hypothetical protein AB8B91_01240 [Rubripirellula sp.]